MRQFAPIAQSRGGSEQRVGVQIEYRLRLGLIPGARLIASEHQHITHAQRGRSDQQTLQGDAIAIAAGQLQHRLETRIGEQRCRAQYIQMSARAGPIRDVDGVGKASQGRGPLDQVLRIG
jgi:hypothetical protein